MTDSRVASFRAIDPVTERVLLIGFRAAHDSDVRFYKRQLLTLGYRNVTFISWFDEVFHKSQLDIVDWDVAVGDPVLWLEGG